MTGISKEKITIAAERICETFEELHLTMEERAIVAYSVYAAAKRFEAFEELERGEKIAEKPQGISKVQIVTAVCSALGITISIIAMSLK